MTRLLLGAAGLVVAAYGAVLLLATGLDNIVAAVMWLAGGVVVHDGLLAPLTLLAGLILVRLAPAPWRAPVTGGLVVLGTVTVAAVPVLGRFGARPDNATLLDRDYVVGWLALVLLTLAGVVVARIAAGWVWHARRREGGSADGTGPRG